MDLEYLHGQMVEDMKVNGKTENNMEEENIIQSQMTGQKLLNWM